MAAFTANVSKKRGLNEAFPELQHAEHHSSKKTATNNLARSMTCQLPTISIPPPQRPESVLSSLAVMQDDSDDEDPMRELDQYRYKPLGTNQFRLLRLHPGAGNDPVHCSLVTDSIGAPACYEALSYCWGERYPAQSILLSDEEPGCTFSTPQIAETTSNLYDALRNIRDSARPLVLWIDALCINQQNDRERGQQVSMMAKIYSQAHRVLVWLGNETASTGWAVSNMRRVPCLRTSLNSGDDIAYRKKSMAWSLCQAWTQFAHSPWFKRAWTFQELALSQRTTFVRGSTQVDSHDLELVLDTCSRSLPALQRIATQDSSRTQNLRVKLDPEPFRLALQRFQVARSAIDQTAEGGAVGKGKGLFQLLTETTHLQTSDARDKIYAILALVDWSSSQPAITPDYSLSLAQVCARVVEYDIDTRQNLESILRPWAPGHGAGSSSSAVGGGMPSWISVLPTTVGNDASRVNRALNQRLVGIEQQYSASRKELAALVRFEPQAPPIEIFSQRGRSTGERLDKRMQSDASADDLRHARAPKDNVLVATGIELATITDLSSPMTGGIVPRDCLEMAGWCFSEGCEALRHKPQELWHRLWRTLIADRDADGRVPPMSYWLAFNKIFKQILRLRCIDAEAMMANETDDNVRQYLARVRDTTWDRQMFTSVANEYGETLLGLTARGSRVGDRIVILYGLSVPLVMRSAEIGGRDYMEIVGGAYVHGKMNGEAFSGLDDAAIRSRTREFAFI